MKLDNATYTQMYFVYFYNTAQINNGLNNN